MQFSKNKNFLWLVGCIAASVLITIVANVIAAFRMIGTFGHMTDSTRTPAERAGSFGADAVAVVQESIWGNALASLMVLPMLYFAVKLYQDYEADKATQAPRP